jgi:hypothetical protein
MKLSQTPEAMELKRKLREAYGLPPREPPKVEPEHNAAEMAWEERVRAMSLERLQRIMDQGQEAYLERLREQEALRTCHRGPGDADWQR